jgi:hypothetical protein
VPNPGPVREAHAASTREDSEELVCTSPTKKRRLDTLRAVSVYIQVPAQPPGPHTGRGKRGQHEPILPPPRFPAFRITLPPETMR